MTFQTYVVPLPVSGNNPKVDQPNMTNNNAAIANLIAQDHFGFNNNAGGNHKQVHLKNTAAPGGIGANADGVFYANLASGQSWPFWQNALGSIQMLSGMPSAAASGYTYLPGGIILQWGVVASPGSSGSVTFPIAFPSTCFNVQLTQRRDSSSSTQGMYVNGAPSASGFAYNGSSSTAQSLFWIAIGN